MDIERLKRHLDDYVSRVNSDPELIEGAAERAKRREAYRQWTAEKIRAMDQEDFGKYITSLWATLIWGNKSYLISKLLEDNSFDALKIALADLIWAGEDISQRWDKFRKSIKGFGPAMMSELLCLSRPQEYMIWNQRAKIGFQYLGVEDSPTRSYQVTGKRYAQMINIAHQIANEMRKRGLEEVDLLTVDYFIWHELQIEPKAARSNPSTNPKTTEIELDDTEPETAEFIHNDVRDKIRDIGYWLVVPVIFDAT